MHCKTALFRKACDRLITFGGLKVAVLGLTFKVVRMDLREAPSLDNVELFAGARANIYAYDPVGIDNFKKKYPEGKIGRGSITYVKRADEALRGGKHLLHLYRVAGYKDITPDTYKKLMKPALVYDGRNIHSLQSMKDAGVEYYSIGR